MGLRVLINKDEKGWKEANVKGLYRDAFSFGNKQLHMQLRGCNITAGTEMWWEGAWPECSDGSALGESGIKLPFT